MSLAKVIARSQQDRESWRYTDLPKLLGTSFPRQSAKPELTVVPVEKDHVRILFINGVWQKDQSHLGDLPVDILQGDATHGYRLALAGQMCLVTQPIELLFLAQGSAATEVATTLHVELGESGRLTLIERHEAQDAVVPHVMETDITLHPQAKLVHGKIIKGGDHAHLAQTIVHVAEGAYYDNFVLIKGGRLTRNEIDARLNGKLAQCTLNGAMLLADHDHADTTTRITHAAPHGTSREVYKSVVADQARGVFQGKIIVQEGAQKTDGQQLSRALLLSDQAEMDSKPELEIYADDVKCSHGSTIGDLDANALFYLQARGLSEAEARAMLIAAFVGEIIDEIHMDDWREACRVEVEEWLHGRV